MIRREDASPQSVPPLVSELASLLGLGLIGLAVFVFDERVPMPGVLALIPTIGTALVIVYSSQQTVVGRALGRPALVGVGLVSYSAYLWHQPLLAFGRTRQDGDLSARWLVATLSICAALSVLTWWAVERPFRDRRRMSRRSVFLFAGGGTTLMLAFGIAGVLSDGFEMRFPELYRVRQSFDGMFGRAESVAQCFEYPNHVGRLCEMGTPGIPPSFVAFGDSHMFSLHEAFDDAARFAGQAGTWVSAEACPPLLNTYVLRNGRADQRCHALNEEVFARARALRVRTAVLVARWNLYADGTRQLSTTTEFSRMNTVAQSRLGLTEGLRHTIEQFATIGIHVVVVLQVPEQTRDPEAVFTDLTAVALASRPAQVRNRSVLLLEHRRTQAVARSLIEQAVRGTSATIVSLDSAYCDAERCLIGSADEPYYANRDHLTPAGAKRASSLLRGVLAN